MVKYFYQNDEELFMAHKTFITYKYSDVVEGNEHNNLRDRIIARLGEDARYYKGEDGFSKDMSSYTAQTIQKHLSDMIYQTSVSIVILSPNMLQSNWMEWEIKYALRNQSRDGQYSHPNGIVAVVQKRSTYGYLDGYQWYKDWFGNWAVSQTFNVIRFNRNNTKNSAPNYIPNNYIDIVTEDEFLHNPSKYIEDAYYKSEHTFYYDIYKG